MIKTNNNLDFKQKFKEMLKEVSKDFNIQWSLVDIEFIDYFNTKLTNLPASLEKYTIRIRVIEDEIPEVDIDNWFKSHKFIYGIMVHVIDLLTFDVGTIESISLKIRAAFRNS